MHLGSTLHLAFASYFTVFKSFGGTAEAWKQLMAMDTAALVIQKLGVAGLDNVHIHVSAGISVQLKISLKSLKIGWCEMLDSLPCGLANLFSLENLEIIGWPNLITLPEQSTPLPWSALPLCVVRFWLFYPMAWKISCNIMAEIVLTPLLQVVFEKVASRVLKEIANRCGFKDEILKLQRSLRMIQAVLEDAEERQAADKALKLWLTELKEVAYDADDLLEEFTPEAMLLQNENTSTQLIPSLNPVIAYLRKLPELNQIRQRLDVLLEERSCFKLKETVGDKDMKGEEYFVFEGGRMPRNFAKLRYVSVVCDSGSCTIPEALYKAKKLRTLIFLYPRGDLGEVPSKLFSSFKYLRVLDLGLNLNTGNDFICKMGENVLEWLQPPENLKRLSLKGYPGISFPRFMSTFKLRALTKLELINCKRCDHLPTLGELPFLEIIYMHRMNAVKTIGREFYGEDTRRLFGSLKELTLIDFPDLELWWSISGGNEFKSLVKLTISKCPRLMNMPQFQSVKHLELRNCQETLLRSVVNVSSLSTLVIDVFTGQLLLLDNLLQNNVNLMCLTISSCAQLRYIPPSLGNLVSLKTLAVRWCEELVSMPLQLQNLSSLQSLEISECHSLSAPPQSITGLISLKHLSIENCSNITLLPIGLQHLSSLEHLTIMYCPSLVSLPNEWQNLSILRSLCILSCPQLSFLPDSIQYVRTLQNLEIHGCPGLNALPEWIINLSLLRSLAISDCPNITSLPDNLQCLSKLQRLSIQECPRLEEHYKKNTGHGWPKIAHIAHIYIGSPEIKKENVAGSSLR
ncbi:hypothetical protein V6N13_143549 [Hibiscus sabdariffa]